MTHKDDHKKDELLEMLWHLDENHDLTIGSLREHDPENSFEKDLVQLSSTGVLELHGDDIHLTDQGKTLARGIIRRHRLAERLLADVLGKTPEETEQAACEFEHILAPELVDSICVLLGHPNRCPHGSVIPEGDCCREARNSVQSIVIRLDEMETGQRSRVSSINTSDETRMTKLLSMGIVPGVKLRLLQKYPVFVIEINQTQIALEKSVGEGINVRRQSMPPGETGA